MRRKIKVRDNEPIMISQLLHARVSLSFVFLATCFPPSFLLLTFLLRSFSDVVNTKVHPQKRRKREPNGTNNFSKNEQPRKWNVQKAKDTVKRPRAKGQNHGGTEENTKVWLANV